MPKPPVRGKELQKSIVSYARLKKWRVAHFPTMQGARGEWRTPVAADGKGFPDLLLVRRGQILAIEVKGTGDTLKPEQREWLTDLSDAGATVAVVKPSDWPEVVQRMLN